ncbi:MAG: hypothetical protein RLZZ500_2449 [Bacteroidota bacterium]|jgi:hypothetical protein
MSVKYFRDIEIVLRQQKNISTKFILKTSIVDT